ncbi:hypothetical protein ICN41_01430 [Polynucleobacter sp. 15G-AUS-farblos]|uniref:hypothetical protein n=1 Tax=Polynucleobacter sp. 15G-AUS-farblos TaxID=2689094 RepID=UPI001C0E24A2|nr:hypothetical protein [Polynucleobacter sp. 15G-AUS-farblos]MBU3582642.1 hypothetical protein [Polynucleobacter sp. 15G-AUS-farblos]
MKNPKIFIPIIIAIIIILVNYWERPKAGPGLQVYDSLIIYTTYIILAFLVSYLYFNQQFLKLIASAGFAIQFISTAILIYNISQIPYIKLDKFLLHMALLMEALRIVAIYCLISHKDTPQKTSTTE